MQELLAQNVDQYHDDVSPKNEKLKDLMLKYWTSEQLWKQTVNIMEMVLSTIKWMYNTTLKTYQFPVKTLKSLEDVQHLHMSQQRTGKYREDL